MKCSGRVHFHLLLVFVLNEASPSNASSSYGTPHSHLFLANWAIRMFIGLSLTPEAHLLFVDVPTQVEVSFFTEKIQSNEPGCSAKKGSVETHRVEIFTFQ